MVCYLRGGCCVAAEGLVQVCSSGFALVFSLLVRGIGWERCWGFSTSSRTSFRSSRSSGILGFCIGG